MTRAQQLDIVLQGQKYRNAWSVPNNNKKVVTDRDESDWYTPVILHDHSWKDDFSVFTGHKPW